MHSPDIPPAADNSDVDAAVERSYASRLTQGGDLTKEEKERIQEKQGGHHYPPQPDEPAPMDDTDRNTDRVVKPSRRKP